MYNDDFLAHIGVIRRSGRYPWGSGNRPFQRTEKSVSKNEKTSGSPRHTPSSARKLAKKRAASLEKARREKAKKAEYEKKKQKALTSGTASDVLKYQGHLTNKELLEAYQRLNYENLIRGFEKADKDKKKTYAKAFDSVENAVKKTTNYVNTGINAWNAFGKVYNAFSEKDEDDALHLVFKDEDGKLKTIKG